MKNNILKYGILAIMFLAFSFPAFASPGDPDDGDDPLPAPIDNWVILLGVAAIVVGIYYINKQNKAIA